MDHQGPPFNNQGGGSGLRPPPHRIDLPRYDMKAEKPSSAGSCFRCLGCCFCILFVLVFLASGLTFFLYTFYRPKIPSYGVEYFGVNAFNVASNSLTIDTEFVVDVRAENPNEKIGFVYGKGSNATVSYSGTELCSGTLPEFQQPVKNVTVMRVVLSGESGFGLGLREALVENKETGKIPLLVKVRVPVSVVMWSLTLRQVVVLVNCSLVVDNLQPEKKARILSTKYSYDVQF